MKANKKKKARLVGWREWGRLPELGIEQIRVKIDTGAKTSALHAEKFEYFTKDGKSYVRFSVYQDGYHRDSDKTRVIRTVAEILSFREIKSSVGVVTRRPVIRTPFEIGGSKFLIQLSLVDRRKMRYPMLLGRRALNKRFVVNSAQEFIQGLPGVAPVLTKEES